MLQFEVILFVSRFNDNETLQFIAIVRNIKTIIFQEVQSIIIDLFTFWRWWVSMLEGIYHICVYILISSKYRSQPSWKTKFKIITCVHNHRWLFGGWSNNEYTIVLIFQNSLSIAATKPHRRKDISSHLCFTLYAN